MDNIEILHQRYARALFDFANETAALDKIMQDLEALNYIIRSNNDIRQMLSHPEIDKAEKLKVLQVISEKSNFSDGFTDFLKVLTKKNRLNLIHGIFLRFRDYYDEERKKVKVLVRSAVELTQAQIDKLSKHLSDYLKEQVSADVEIDPSLIGGLYLKFHDRIYDASVAGMLHNINKRLSI